MDKETIKRKYQVPALDKMDAIFHYLQKSGKPAGLAEISRETAIPKTTCMRLLDALSEHDYLVKDSERGLFAFGIKLFALGQCVSHNVLWLKMLETHLDAFAEKIGEAVKISAIVNKKVTVLYKAESSAPMRITFTPGMIFPLHAGGASKMLLALMAGSSWQKILPKKLIRYTPNTLCTIDELNTAILEIRKQGYGIDREEFQEGIMAVSVPIKLPGMEGALSIPFIKPFEPQKKIDYLLLELQREAESLKQKLASVTSVH